jgi:hypothetical protein
VAFSNLQFQSEIMLKTINIGGQQRPILFGFNAKRRLDPILRETAKRFAADNGGTVKQEQLGLLIYTDAETQITLLKIGLEEGQRFADGAKMPHEIHETTIADWLDDRPEAINEAIEIYTDQQLTIQARRIGEEPEKFIAMARGEVVTSILTENQNGTPSSELPSAGSV